MTDIVPGSAYGLQICAIASDDIGPDQAIDWAKEAWTGTMNFTTYQDYAAWISHNGDQTDSDEVTDITEAPTVSA